MYYQTHDVTNTEYVEHLKALVGVVVTYGGEYGQDPGLVVVEPAAQGVKPKVIATTDSAEITEAKKVCHECYLSCMLL